METEILTSKNVRKAASLIKAGEVVVFPTETVYGIGADALNPKAIKKIFRVKGRPTDNPLIVHISKKEDLYNLAKFSKSKEELIKKLTKKFWPGPLTLILKKKAVVPKETTGGLDTIAIRMPKHNAALDLISYAETPIAAPSANISGKPSGTSFAHVKDYFDGKVLGIIKSTNCEVGLESTVLDLSSSTPKVLRPGGISIEALQKYIPKLSLAKNKAKKVKSPGMKYKHYAPKAKVILFDELKEMKDYRNILRKKGKKVRLIEPKKIKDFHKKLFHLLIDSDNKQYDYILILKVEEKGMGLAIMNRLSKASEQ